MTTPGIIGLETEYGVLAGGNKPFDSEALFRLLQEDSQPLAARTFSTPWDYYAESPWLDARGFMPAATGGARIEIPIQMLAGGGMEKIEKKEDKPAQDDPDLVIESEKPPCFMLHNGARFYLDHTHPEWSIPESANPMQAVAYDRAGEIWLSELAAAYNAQRDPAEHITLFKNNVDFFGNSYGCHENYSMDAVTYQSLFGSHAHRLYTVWIPFLVTRQILCGAGKVALGDTNHFGFHISQRADFTETILGLQTTHARPLVNTRDEPHADPMRFRRLHVIAGDANLSEFSTYLKVGTTALVLEAMAANKLRLDLTLANPLQAIRQISADPTLIQTVEMEAGNRFYRAVDVQRAFVEAVGLYLDELDDHTFRRDVWIHWADTVDRLSSEPFQLADRIDWLIKYQMLQSQMANKGWEWADASVRELDVKYHQINPQRNIFSLLQQKGLVKRLVSPEALQYACAHPPQNTRARLRVECLHQFAHQIQAVSWHSVVFQGNEGRVWRWLWSDPFDNGEELIARFREQAVGMEELVVLALSEKLASTEAKVYGKTRTKTSNAGS